MPTAQLDTNGFAVLENLLSDVDCAHLTDSLENIDLDRTLNRGDVAYGIRDLLNVAPFVREFADSQVVRAVVDPIAGKEARVVRAIFFDKTPEANWKVTWHQDLSISVRERKDVDGFTGWSVKAGIHHTQPPVAILENILTMRIHLDATDESNGALRVIPGSHRYGRLDVQAISKLKDDGQVVLCCLPRGGALLMRPLILHASSAGSKPTHRRVIHLEFSAEQLPEGLEWFGG